MKAIFKVSHIERGVTYREEFFTSMKASRNFIESCIRINEGFNIVWEGDDWVDYKTRSIDGNAMTITYKISRLKLYNSNDF